MIKLYGLRMSNFYSLTKALLIEKGLDFEEVKTPPSQDEDFLSRSPMGKMPAIEVDGRYLSETMAIAAYLERAQPEPPMLPGDPFEVGKILELVCHFKFDIDLAARPCLPQLFGRPVSDETKASTLAALQRGVQAVSRIVVCDPWAAGSEFTLADLYANYCFAFANTVASQVLEADLLSEQPQLTELLGRIAERPSVARVTADRG